LQPAFGLITLLAAAASAGLGNGRAARRRRVVAEIARRLLTGDQLLDLLARQRLVFEQAFGDGNPFLLLLAQYGLGGGVGLVDEPAHFGVDDLRRLLRDV